jgi:Zn-dependent metalloprotease
MLVHLQGIDPMVQFHYDKELDVIRHLRGNLGQIKSEDPDQLQSAVLEFFMEHNSLFGDVSLKQLQPLTQNFDVRRGRNLIFQQCHGSHRVYGGSVRFHVSSNGTLDIISNHLFPDLSEVPLEPTIDIAEAVKRALRGMKEDLPSQEHQLLVYRHDGKARLVWELILGGKPGEPVNEQWMAYVDAVNGALLLRYDNIPSGGAADGTGEGRYSGSGALKTWFTDTTYQLRDTTRLPQGPEIITDDEANAIYPAEDIDNNWNGLNTTPRGNNQGPLVDCHRYTNQVYQYFQTHHGRNSWDDRGGNFETYVHYPTTKFGVFFGNIPRSGTNPGVAKIGLSDGDMTSYDYCCCDDWIAHEFAHAYEAATSNLRGSGESGALKEAICDIFAAFITGDWLVFEESWLKGPVPPAARNMMDPTNGDLWENAPDYIAELRSVSGHSPSHYNKRYHGLSSWDNGFVHANAGIINHLFYLLTVGGTHSISNISVTGIGQAAAEQLLYNCMAKLWDGGAMQDAQFLDFRQAMLDSCVSLFPCDHFKLSQVKNAFNAVGIGPDIYVRDNLTDTGLEPFPGAFLWASPDIINRTAPSQNPNGQFANLNDDGLWENVEFGQDNYVYVRLQNRGAHPGDATISLYFSPATTFGTPGSWTHIGILLETGIAPGALRIAGPLTFPKASIPVPGHYCMIAVVTSAFDPAPDLTCIATVSDYLNAVRNSNNIAYRNMDVVDLTSASSDAVDVNVQNLQNVPDTFDLQIEVDRLIPGAKVRVHGPGEVLDGAVGHGLKLVGRDGRTDIYELLTGKELLVWQRGFIRHGKPLDEFRYGFQRVLVRQVFRLRLQYVLPEKSGKQVVGNGTDTPAESVVRVKQLWHGEAVGAFTVKFRPPRPMK